MMEETGTVVELRPGGTAMVLCRKGSACGHCSAADKCEMGRDSGERLVETRNQVGADVGDQVRISISSRTFLKSSFLVYIVPLIVLVIGAVLGGQLSAWIGKDLDPNLLSAAFGIAGLVISLLVIRGYNRKLERERYLPRIVAILGSEQDYGH